MPCILKPISRNVGMLIKVNYSLFKIKVSMSWLSFACWEGSITHCKPIKLGSVDCCQRKLCQSWANVLSACVMTYTSCLKYARFVEEIFGWVIAQSTWEFDLSSLWPEIHRSQILGVCKGCRSIIQRVTVQKCFHSQMFLF